MSKIEDGGSAFPLNPDVNFAHTGEIYRDACGMSLRDWFAGQALAGLLANSGGPIQSNSMSGWGYCNCSAGDVVSEAFRLADAMLACRAKTEGGEG